MKKLLVAGIAAAAFCGAPAFAADMPVKAEPAPIWNWTGLYVAADAGGMWTGKFDGPFTNPIAPGNSYSASGVDTGIAGFRVGGQKQFGNWVLGIDGGLSLALSDKFGTTLSPGNAPPIGCNSGGGTFCQARISSIWDVGPRLGYAANQWMIYGTGGFAQAHVESRFLAPAPSFDAITRNNGWFAGAGLEWLITPRAAVGVDYKHYGFNNANTGPSIGAGAQHDIKTDADVVTARLTLLFMPPFN
jgi:outer membrane immunogenic protein